MKYSFVIPALNEAESLGPLYQELQAQLDRLDGDAEVIFVDDGSSDETPARIAELAARDNRVHGVVLARNLGKSLAYTAGFDAARGQLIVTLDADLQDDPGELGKLLAQIESGADLVVGRKEGRRDNEPGKAIASLVFNGLKRWLLASRLRDSNSGYRVMRREVMESLHLYGDLYRFIPDLAQVRGFRVMEAGVQHRPRRYGETKFGPARFWTGLLDLLSVRFTTAFREKPIHFFGTLGAVSAFLGLGLEIYVLVRKLLGGTFQTHVAAIIVGVMLILLGVQMVGLSLIGELIAAQQRGRRYIVRRRIGTGHPDSGETDA